MEGDDPDWSWTRKAAIELLASGLRRGADGIPFEHAEHVQALILELYRGAPRQPDTENFEESYRSFPHFGAQSTSRGAAVELCVLFIFWRKLGWTGGSGYVPIDQGFTSWFSHLILPWSALALLYAAFYARMTRNNLLETLGEDYIRTARAKGLSERKVILKHGLRASLTPIATIFEQNRRPEADVQLQRALAFYRSVGATRYIRQAEGLLAASA